jgi:hypothetical protein
MLLAYWTVLASACGGEGEPEAPAPPPNVERADPCGGKCNETELCTRDRDGKFGCNRICVNQLRCWSGCCLPLEGTNLNVCRPTNYCFPE